MKLGRLIRGVRKSDLEKAQTFDVEFAAADHEAAPAAAGHEAAPATDLTDSTERVERALETEHSRAISLNIRGTALAAVSAIGILLLAQFSATWLDDNSWNVTDIADTALRILLPVTVVLLALAALAALIALWPRGHTSTARRDRLNKIVVGDDAAQAELLVHMTEQLRATNETRNRYVRVATVLFAFALLGTIAQSMVFAFVAEPADAARTDAPTPPEVDPEGLPSADEQLRLALTYAPRVWLHALEVTGPLDPRTFIDRSRLVWNLHRRVEQVAARGTVVAERLGRRCNETSSGCYQHNRYLARELTRPFTRHPTRPPSLVLRRGFALDVEDAARDGQSRRHPDAPVFFEVRKTPKELLLTFWFFYGYSTPHVVEGSAGARRLTQLFSHEGDWENVEVALSPDASTPVALYFYGHGSPSRVEWPELDCVLESGTSACEDGVPGHPIVYSALESHASYGTAGRTKVCGALGLCANDLRNEGWRWDTWFAPGSVRPVRSEPWYGYGGGWGAVGTVSDTTGPVGPRAGKLPTDPNPGELAATE